MKVTIIGATGRTGRQVLHQALDAGHEVTAFTPHPENVEVDGPRLRVVRGDVQNLASVRRAVEGQEAVLSALGPTPSSTGDVMTTDAAHVVRAMEEQGVQRLIWLTGAGIEAEGDEPSVLRTVVQGFLTIFSPSVFEDSARVFEIVSTSDLHWTLVRAPRLKDGPAEGGYRATFKLPGPQALSRADVAALMLGQLRDDRYVRRAPMVAR